MLYYLKTAWHLVCWYMRYRWVLKQVKFFGSGESVETWEHEDGTVKEITK